MSAVESTIQWRIDRQLFEAEGAEGVDNSTFEFCLSEPKLNVTRPVNAATNAGLKQVIASRAGWNKNNNLVTLGRGTILNIGEATLSTTFGAVTKKYNLSVRHTERGIQSIYAVPYSPDAHVRSFSAILEQLKQPAGMEFGICLGEGDNQECFLDCGDPVGVAEPFQHRRELEDLKTIIEQAQVGVGKVPNTMFRYRGEDWVISGDYSTGLLQMRSVETHETKTIRCVIYQWYFTETNHAGSTEFKFTLQQQAELEFHKRTGAASVELEFPDGTIGVVDLISEPMIMWKKGYEFGRMVVHRKGTPFSEDEKQFLGAVKLCSQNIKTLCRNPDFQPVKRLRVNCSDFKVIKGLFENAGIRKPVIGQDAYPRFFTPLSPDLDLTKGTSYCGFRQIGHVYSLFSAEQARVYTEYKKMLQLQPEDANGQRFSSYLKSTTPEELFSDDSVNELYLWMYMDTEHAGGILTGHHLPAARNMSDSEFVLFCH